MAVRKLSFDTSNINANGGAKTERKEAEVWLNVGICSTDAEGNETFISLPMGIAVDTMEKLKTRTSNKEYADMVNAKNKLLEMLQQAGAELEPGEEQVVAEDSGLRLQLRRRQVEAGSTDDDNVHSAAIQGLRL